MSDDYITLDTNFSIQSGFAFPSSAFVDEGIPIVRMSDLKTGSLKFENTKYVSSNWLDIASLFRLKEGDFVLGMSGSLSNYAKVTINDVPALLNQRVGRLVSKNLSNSYEYASYWLKSEFYQHYADIQGEGAAQKNISPKKIGAFKIRDVDKPIQDKIVSFLATIDQTIEKTEALIAKYQLIKAGLMQDLFTRGIGADGKLRPTREQAPELYQETQIGWIPKDWTIEKCGDLFTIQLGKMLSQDFKTGIDESVYLGNKNVQWDYCDFSNLESMNFNDFEKEKYRLIQGDLLVCEGGDVGRAAIWREEITDCYYQKAIHRLRPINEQLLPHLMLRFLFYAKNAGMLTNYVSQTSIAHLTREKLAALPVFVPSVEEQQQLIIRFDAIDLKLHNESEQLTKLFKQKQGLMHDLLTGKKRVTVNECEADHV